MKARNGVLQTTRHILKRLERFPSSEVANALVFLGLMVNFLLVIATGILSYYSYRQWVAVNQTLQEVKKQTPAVLESGQAAHDSANTAAKEAASSDKNTEEALAQMRKQSDAERTLADATIRLATTSANRLDLSERPVLVLSQTTLSSVGINRYALVSYGVSVKVDNDGPTPATNAVVLSDLILYNPKGSYSPQGEIKQTCHKYDKAGPLAGIMIAPGTKAFQMDQPPPSLASGDFLRIALSKAHIDPQTGNRVVNGQLPVCLLYRSPISKEIHHTGLNYDVSLTFTEAEAKEILGGSMDAHSVINLWENQISLHRMEIMNGIVD